MVVARRLLFNLSFDAALRDQMVKASIIPKLVELLKCDRCVFSRLLSRRLVFPPRLLVVLSARADVCLRLSSSVILSSSRRRLVGARSGPAVVVVEAPPSPRVLKRPQHTQLKTSHHSRLDLRVGSGRVRATAVAQAPTLPRGDAAAALPHVRRRPLQVAVHVHRGYPDRDAGASSSVAWD